MRNRGKINQSSKHATAIAIALGLLSAPGAFAAGDQKDFFMTTDTKNRKASDDSMQVSTTYAMTALMDLASFKIPSAVNNGMTAYGKYRNSETLDRLGDENVRRAASMGSVGTGDPSLSTVKTQTSFRRLDASFLRTGEAGKVAAEFEKRSGMPREKFLEHMSAISEKKISRYDPQMVDKVLGRFEGFINEIPNPEFRGNLQKAVNMVPSSARTGLIGKAVAKFANLMSVASGGASAGDSGVSAGVAAVPTTGGEAPATDAAAAAEALAAVAGVEDARAPASTEGSNVPTLGASLNEIPVPAGSDKAANPLGSVVQAAITSSQGQAQDQTIFQQVSRVYRGMAGYFAKTK